MRGDAYRSELETYTDIDRGHRLVDALRHQVAVDVEGDLDRGVAHLLLENLRMGAGVDQQRGAGVAQIVEAEASEPGPSTPANTALGTRSYPTKPRCRPPTRLALLDRPPLRRVGLRR